MRGYALNIILNGCYHRIPVETDKIDGEIYVHEKSVFDLGQRIEAVLDGKENYCNERCDCKKENNHEI